MARLVACAAAGVDPTVMGLGPVPATQKALALAGWSIADLDLIELNEAFAAQSLGVIRTSGSRYRKGQCAWWSDSLGSSLAWMPGSRILTTLVHAMRRRGARRGLATLCVGVGQGESTLVELMDA